MSQDGVDASQPEWRNGGWIDAIDGSRRRGEDGVACFERRRLRSKNSLFVVVAALKTNEVRDGSFLICMASSMRSGVSWQETDREEVSD